MLDLVLHLRSLQLVAKSLCDSVLSTAFATRLEMPCSRWFLFLTQNHDPSKTPESFRGATEWPRTSVWLLLSPEFTAGFRPSNRKFIRFAKVAPRRPTGLTSFQTGIAVESAQGRWVD